MQAPAASSHKALIGSPRLSAIPPSANAPPAASASPSSFRIIPPLCVSPDAPGIVAHRPEAGRLRLRQSKLRCQPAGRDSARWHVESRGLLERSSRMGTLERFLLGFVLAVAPADPVALTVTFSPRFESDLRTAYGADQAPVLRDAIVTSVTSALKRKAAGKQVSIDVVLEWAKPSHPTPFQLDREPGLDFQRSKSLGGAGLTATIRAPDGRELGRVEYTFYPANLWEASPAIETWADATRSIVGFASEVAKKVSAVG